MKLNQLNPGKALNKAFLKVKPNRAEIERFKTNLIQLLNRESSYVADLIEYIELFNNQLTPKKLMKELVKNKTK
jgi:hypothetical protein